MNNYRKKGQFVRIDLFFLLLNNININFMLMEYITFAWFNSKLSDYEKVYYI